MGSSQTTSVESADAINEIVKGDGVSPSDLSLEALVLLVNLERLKHLQNKTNSEFKELKERQAEVSKLQKLLKKINALTSNAGELDITSNAELQQLLKEAKEMGVDMNDQQKFTKTERDALVENIRMTIDDKNVKNDMQLQAVNRLTNERYEAYQMARSILKPLHDSKMKIIQGIK